MTQICFLGEDGYMYCNAIVKNGKLVFSKGKWFKFLPRKKKN